MTKKQSAEMAASGVRGSNAPMDDYQRFIAVSRYARWLPDEQRRETWAETVDRYCDFIIKGIDVDSKRDE